jgi:hypothetical protein
MDFSSSKLRIISYNIHNNETWMDFGLVPCGTSKLVKDLFLVRKWQDWKVKFMKWKEVCTIVSRLSTQLEPAQFVCT